MASFDLGRIRHSISEYMPREMPNLPNLPNLANLPKARRPSWLVSHSSMNPDDDDGPPVPPIETYSSPRGQATQPSPMVLAELKPIKSGPKSNLDLVNECDSFPYYQTDTKLFFAHINTYYALYVAGHPETELGYLLPSVASVFQGLPDWEVDDKARSLTLLTGKNEEERSKAVALTTQALRATKYFNILDGWRDELYPVYGANRELLFSVERAASALFGIVSYGCHLTAYTRSRKNGKAPAVDGDLLGHSEEEEQLKLWIPKRAATKQTYPSMLDNTVAGGIATGERPFDSMVRECAEEASLPEELVRWHAKSVGTVTYFHIRDHRAGGETRLLQPECQYVYDLELPEDVIPTPSDDEVEGFELMGIGKVKEHLRAGDFKPNCAMVLLDFFVRHGILGAEEEGFVEIVSRLHRRLEFPTV